MKIKLTFITVLLFLSTQLIAQKFTIDPGHSNIQIRVERFGVVDVVGRFGDVTGGFTVSSPDATIANAEAVIKVASYDANNAPGEEAVKSKAFLDATSFPEIIFKGMKSIKKNGKDYLIGELTIHGETKQIELPYTVKGPLMDLPSQKQSIAFEAATTINRQDYGISFDRKLPDGSSLIGNDVKISLTVLALAE